MKKWYVIAILIVIVLIAGLIIQGLFEGSAISPSNTLKSTMDTKRQSDLKTIAIKANAFCHEMRRCPSALSELLEEDYIDKIPTDPDSNIPYTYELTEDGYNCILKAVLSTKEIITQKCITSKAP